MSDENEGPTPVPDDCEGPRLDTIREVMKEMAATARLIKRGHLDAQRGGVLTNLYGAMLKGLQDQRDSKWLPRVKQLWAEKQQKAQQPEAH